MKKQLLLILGLFALLPSLTFAQSKERMLIYSKSGEVFPYRAEHIDSIKFLTNDVDLSLNPTVTPHESGETGKMKQSYLRVRGHCRGLSCRRAAQASDEGGR